MFWFDLTWGTKQSLGAGWLSALPIGEERGYGSDDKRVLIDPTDCEILQYTGKKGFNERELYEGDIVFYEEAEEGGDRRYYLVIVWVAEWSMFASLHVDEYKKYIENGKDELDEPLFWTYTLEDSEHFHFAGTIYETPELLTP